MESNKIIRVKKAIPIDNYLINLVFDDETAKTVDFKPFIKNGVSAALRDINYFKTVKIESGFIYWENGFDFCPEFLYHL